jgi:L-cysteine desulfidase
MDMNEYGRCLKILTNELIPALGCTEPIAIAYACAKAREVLGKEADSIHLQCSGNVVKNVKSVTVPNSGGLKGLEASAILGAVGGDPSLILETLSTVTEEDRVKTRELLEKGYCTVSLLEGSDRLQIIATLTAGEENALVEIIHSHTHIRRIEHNGETVHLEQIDMSSVMAEDASTLTLETIHAFASTVQIEDIKDLMEMQISYNTAIANEGLTNEWGAQVGKTLLSQYGDDIKVVARALPAAGSDARMNGCSMPVVINSGSGNQGMTVSLPVIAWAQHLGSTKEQLYRALILSNLIALHQKALIGKLSAFCGVVSAAAGAGAAIAFLHGHPLSIIKDTITNTLANISGMVCDGAKSSCAAKIASAVDAAQMGFHLATNGRVFPAGDGLVGEKAEETIQAIGRMARDGMKTTDIEILSIMMGE